MDEPQPNNAMAVAAPSSDLNNNNNNNEDETVSLDTLWDTLQDEFTNMGRALTCPLCLSTYRDAVVLPCVHAYCRSCLKEALHQGPPRCPTCLTKATKRSMASAPILNQLTKAYKLALRHFGLAPVQFDPSYNAMTQIAPGEMEMESKYAGMGLTMEPAPAFVHRNASDSARRKSSDLLASHTQLLVSKTWQKVLNERQQEAEEIAEKLKKKRSSRSNTSKTIAPPVAAAKLPSNIPTQNRLHSWYQQQQQAVCKSHERMLLDAVAAKQAPPSPTPHIDLSMQHEISMEYGLEQELAIRQMEEEQEEWEREEERLLKKKEQEKGADEDLLDAKPAAKPTSTTTTGTQDFFTPREAESQGTMNVAQNLVDLSSMPGNNSKNNKETATARNISEPQPLLSMAEDSFRTANSVVQESQEGQATAAAKAIDDNDNQVREVESPKPTDAFATAVTMGQPTLSESQSYEARTPVQSNSAPRMDNDNSNNNDTNASATFSVGDLLKVQDRTWSGINKPGGIARITKVLVDSSSYHVEYILGGREKHVDAVFLSLPPEEMDWVAASSTGTTTAETATAKTSQRGRKSKRLSTKVKVKAEVEAEVETALPPELMKQLAKEGFDVTPMGGKDVFPVAAARQVKIKAEPGTKRSRSESRAGAKPKPAAGRRSKSEGNALPNGDPKKRGRPNTKKKPILQTQSAAEQERKDHQARNTQSAATGKTAATKKTTNKRRKTVVSNKTAEMPPSSPSKVELCTLADGHYRERVLNMLDSSTPLCIIASGLSDVDKTALKALSKTSKQNGGVQLRLSDVFHPQKTAFCIIPASPSRDNQSNLVGQCRTLKAMRSVLAGVPLVSSDWIDACRRQNQVVIPLDSMWIRSLPVKTQTAKGKGIADFGIAKMAVQTSILGSHQILKDYTACLCGTFARPPRPDVQLLLREAGAELSVQTQSTLAFLRNMDTGSSFVLICDDACTSINPSVYHQIETTLLEFSAKRVLVVNPQWLFDSVAAGSALPMAPYAPAKKNGQPFALWKALQP